MVLPSSIAPSHTGALARSIALFGVGLFIQAALFGQSGVSKPCLDPNFTATIEGDADFSACGAYAYKVLWSHAILGESGNRWITLGFNTKDKAAIVPGTYKITDGASVPKGQAFSVNFVYKIVHADKSQTNCASTDGTLILTEADGDRFKGSFSAATKEMEGEGTRKIEGEFDVRFR